MRKILTALLTLVFVGLLGLTAVQSATAAPATAAVTKVRSTLHADGSWRTTVNGVPASAETEAATTPIANHRFYFGPGYNPERLLCIKDYTPESTVSWDVNRVAVEWSKANEFHVWWDDMNGGGNNCITYDDKQTIKLYSYGDAGSDVCGSVSIDLNASGFILSATGWLNRVADNTACRQTFTLRQNIASSVVGRILGLQWHTAFADSVMCKYLTYRLQIPYPRPADFNGIAARY